MTSRTSTRGEAVAVAGRFGPVCLSTHERSSTRSSRARNAPRARATVASRAPPVRRSASPVAQPAAATVEETEQAGTQSSEGVTADGPGWRCGQKVVLDGLEDGKEECLLVGEVMVKRSAGDAGVADDLPSASREVALLFEELPCRRQYSGPRRFGSLGHHNRPDRRRPHRVIVSGPDHRSSMSGRRR